MLLKISIVLFVAGAAVAAAWLHLVPRLASLCSSDFPPSLSPVLVSSPPYVRIFSSHPREFHLFIFDRFGVQIRCTVERVSRARRPTPELSRTTTRSI